MPPHTVGEKTGWLPTAAAAVHAPNKLDGCCDGRMSTLPVWRAVVANARAVRATKAIHKKVLAAPQCIALPLAIASEVCPGMSPFEDTPVLCGCLWLCWSSPFRCHAVHTRTP